MIAAEIMATMQLVLNTHRSDTHMHAHRQMKLDVCARRRTRLCVVCTCTNQVL